MAGRVAGLVIVGLVLVLVGHAGRATADRFGPPWMAEVTADGVVVRGEPDPSAAEAGPLSRGDIVPVLAEQPGGDGAAWTRIATGWVPTSAVQEITGPWIAGVIVPQVNVLARPNRDAAASRQAPLGAYLRVTGVSPALDGDTGAYWATTEGWVPLDAVRRATTDEALAWRLPPADWAPKGWWGELHTDGNVRLGASTQSPVVGQLDPGEHVKVLAEEQGEAVGGNAVWYVIDGGRFAGARVHSSLVSRLPDPTPHTDPPAEGQTTGTWLVVSRADHTLTLVQDGQPRFVTHVALGRASKQTATGVFHIFGKFLTDTMTSASLTDAEGQYHQPNVPWTEYYAEDGFAIHGTYWHDHFDEDTSQGCVNLTVTDAAYLFSQTWPPVATGDDHAWAEGTPVVIIE